MDIKIKATTLFILFSLLFLAASPLTVEGAAEHAGHHQGDPEAENEPQDGQISAAVGILLFGVFAGVIAGAGSAQLFKNRFTNSQLIIIGLTTITAVIHLFLGFSGDLLLLLNGFGYFALLIMIFAPIEPLAPYRKMLLWGLLVYTGITVTGYFLTHYGQTDGLGLGTKLFEVLLVRMVLVETAKV